MDPQVVPLGAGPRALGAGARHTTHGHGHLGQNGGKDKHHSHHPHHSVSNPQSFFSGNFRWGDSGTTLGSSNLGSSTNTGNRRCSLPHFAKWFPQLSNKGLIVPEGTTQEECCDEGDDSTDDVRETHRDVDIGNNTVVRNSLIRNLGNGVPLVIDEEMGLCCSEEMGKAGHGGDTSGGHIGGHAGHGNGAGEKILGPRVPLTSSSSHNSSNLCSNLKENGGIGIGQGGPIGPNSSFFTQTNAQHNAQDGHNETGKDLPGNDPGEVAAGAKSAQSGSSSYIVVFFFVAIIAFACGFAVFALHHVNK